jgi:integrase
MAKTARLKPRKTDRPTPWEISIPPHMSATGKRERRYFETRQSAEWEIESIRRRRMSFGETLEKLSPSRASEALKAYELLEGHDITLLDAVTGFLGIHKDRNKSIPFLDLFNQVLEAKKDRDPEYLRKLKEARDRWPELHTKFSCDITHRDLEAILSKLTPGARNVIMRYWNVIFNSGVKKGYVRENPVERLDFERRKRREVETLSNAQVKGMLEHALANDIDLLPFLVLGCFCGIRPRGELTKIEWRDIDLSGKVVTIRPEVSKTNRRRFVDLSDNAAEWLRAYQQRGGRSGGRIMDWDPEKLRDHRTANRKAAGIERWIQQGMRHTYCFAWLAMHGDVNKLVLQSGHDSVDTMWRNYHRGTTKAEAERFWRIRPPKRTGSRKIVPFAA